MLIFVCIVFVFVLFFWYVMTTESINNLYHGKFVDQEFREWDFQLYRSEVRIKELGVFNSYKHGNKIKIGDNIYKIYWKPFIGIVLKNESSEFILRR